MSNQVKTATPNTRFESLHSPFIAWAVLVVSIILTITASLVSNHYLQERELAKFKINSEKIKKAVLERVKVYNQALKSAAALIDSSNEVTRNEWKNFVEAINLSENWPGIQGIGFSIPIDSSQLRQHIAEIRAEGFADYKVKPAEDREFYTSIIYLEPFNERNQRAFGYDMWSNLIRREAMKKSRDTGKSTMSGLVTLVQEDGEDIQKGFLVYRPVYDMNSDLQSTEQREKALKGWVYAAFRTNDFMKGILSSVQSPFENLTSLRIYDGSESSEKLLYESAEHPADTSNEVLKNSIEVFGRKWSMVFVRHNNISQSEKYIPIIIAIGGILVDVFIFYIIYAMVKMRQKNTETEFRLKDTNEKLIESDEARFTSEQHIKAIVESTVDGIVTIDSQGIIQTFNKACERLFAYSREEVLGKNVNMLMPEPYHSEHDDYIKNFLKTNDAKIIGIGREVEALRKDGTTFPIDLAIGSFLDRGKPAFTGIIRDITERKNSQIAQDMLIGRLLSSNTDLERFAYVASHDLQEPLRMVTSFTQLLSEEYADEIDSTGKEYIKYAHDSAQRMQKLVSGLLEYSRITSVDSAIEEIDLNDVLSTVKENLMQIISDNNATIKCSSLPTVKMKKVHAIQLFQNIISNAIKYRKEDVQPEINIYSEEDNDSWILKFCDNGIGIDEKDFDKIFSPFRRLHSYSEYKGTGIGLSVCKKIINNTGGDISVHSIPGHGANFTVTFPKEVLKNRVSTGVKNEKAI